MTIDSNLTISFSSILEEKAFLFAEEAVRLRYNLKSQREYHVADQFSEVRRALEPILQKPMKLNHDPILFTNSRLHQRN